MKFDKLFTALTIAIGSIILIILIATLAAWPVKWIWNDLIIELFNVKKISFLEALQLTILCNILFKSSPSISTKKD